MVAVQVLWRVPSELLWNCVKLVVCVSLVKWHGWRGCGRLCGILVVF